MTLNRTSGAAVSSSSELVQRRLDEHTVTEYQRIAGQMAGVIPAPPMIESAVKRLIAAEEDASASR